MKKPQTWDECVRLLRDANNLDLYLRGRLVELSGQNDSTGLRAIEALLGIGSAAADDGLGDVSTEDLLNAERRALNFLQSLNGSSDGQTGEPGTVAPTD